MMYASCDIHVMGMKCNMNWLVVRRWHEIIMLEMTCRMLLVKELHGKLLEMVWLVYILI